MTRLLLPILLSLFIATTAQANLCKQSLSLINTSKNSILDVSSKVSSKLVAGLAKARVLRATSELDKVFVGQMSEAYSELLKAGKSQQEVTKIVIGDMNASPSNQPVLQLEHILAFEHAKKKAGLVSTSLYDEWKALESVDKRIFIFKTGNKRKIKIKTRRLTSHSNNKLVKFLFNFKVKMSAKGFADPSLILPRRSPKNTEEIVEYTWQLSKKMYDIRFASQFVLPSFYTIGTYPVISSNGAPHTPVNFDTRQQMLAGNAKQTLSEKSYMKFAFYQGNLFLSNFGKAFTKDYRNKIIGALAYHDSMVYEMLTNLRETKPDFMPLRRSDKMRMGGIRNHVYGLLSMIMANPTPRLNRLGIHRTNLKDYNEIFDIYGLENNSDNTSVKTAEYLAAKYNKKFGTKLNYKWTANNVGRMWFAAFAGFTLMHSPQILAAGKNVNLPMVIEVLKVTPGTLWGLGSDVFLGVDRNAKSYADSYTSQASLWKIFDNLIAANNIYTSTEKQQESWSSFWSGENSFLVSKWDSYVLAYKLLNGQPDFVKNAESAQFQLSRANKGLKKRLGNKDLDAASKASLSEQIEIHIDKIEQLSQQIEASTDSSFVASLEMYLKHFENMEANELAKIRTELGSPSEADFINALEIYLNNQ